MALSCSFFKLSLFLRSITSKHNSDFYCWNCLHSFKIESKLKSHKNVCENKDFCICGKQFSTRTGKDKNYQKVRDDCYFADKYRGTVDSICNLRFRVPNEIPVVFYNGSNYKSSSVPIEKEIKKLIRMVKRKL